MSDEDNTTTDLVVVKKNVGGRPTGAKDKDKRISPYAKAQIKALYLAGHTADDIMVALKVGNKLLIQKWAREENWDEERDKLLATTTSEMLTGALQSQKENFAGLKLIKDRSIESLMGGKNPDGSVRAPISPQKYPEAVNAYLSALEIEYKLKIDALQTNFLNDVIQVLREKIQDRNLLSEIGTRLRDVLEKYQNRKLPEPRKE